MHAAVEQSGVRDQMSVTRWLLLTLVAGVPLVFARIGGDPFNAPKFSFLLIGVGIALVLAARRSWELPSDIAWPIAAAVIPLVLSWGVNGHKGWTWLGEYARFQGLLSGLAFAAFTLLLVSVFRSHPTSLAGALSLGGAGVAVYAVAQMFGLDPFSWSFSDFAASSVGHSNFAGAVLAITLPVTVALWLKSKHRALYRGATILSVLALIGTFSQGAWGGAVAGLVTWMGLMTRERFPRAAWLGLFGALTIALGNIVLVVASHVGGEQAFLYGTSVWARGLSWRTAIAIGFDNPLFGSGPNSFAYVTSRYRHPLEALGERANDPHSVPLTFLSDLGAVGLLGFLVLAGWITVRVLRARGPLAAGFAGGAVAYLTVSVVTVNDFSVRAVFWVCVAGLVLTRDGGPARPGVRRNLSVVAAALLSGFMFVVWGGGLLMGELAFARSMNAVARDDAVEAKSWYVKLTKIPGNHFHQRQLLGERAGEAALRSIPDEEPFWQVSRAAHGSIEDFPYVRYVGSSAYWLSQRSAFDDAWLDDALLRWQKAAALDPFDGRPAIEESKLLIRLGQTPEALMRIERFALMLEEREVPMPISWRTDLTGLRAIALVARGERQRAADVLQEVTVGRTSTCLMLIAEEILDRRSDPDSGYLQLDEISPELRIRCDPASLVLLGALSYRITRNWTGHVAQG